MKNIIIKDSWDEYPQKLILNCKSILEKGQSVNLNMSYIPDYNTLYIANIEKQNNALRSEINALKKRLEEKAICDDNLSQEKEELNSEIDVKPDTKALAKKLVDAIAFNDFEKVKELLKAGADPSEPEPTYGHYPLIEAIERGRSAMANHLLLKGADPNVQGKNGNTILMIACAEGDEADESVISALLKGGADPNVRNKNGYTALMIACSHGARVSVISALLKGGSDLYAKSRVHGRNALMLAAMVGELDAAKKLVEFGADYRIRDNEGKTALWWAIKEDEIETGKFLVDIEI